LYVRQKQEEHESEKIEGSPDELPRVGQRPIERSQDIFDRNQVFMWVLLSYCVQPQRGSEYYEQAVNADCALQHKKKAK
jgi:hypothetical protein